jgi:hypothetical protein
VVALDLNAPSVQRALGLTRDDLTSDDLHVCQVVANIAADAGFEAVYGPSGALNNERTLAVFGSAIDTNATDLLDKGSRTAPLRLGAILRAVRLPPRTAGWLGRLYDEVALDVERQLAARRAARR